MLTIDEIKNVGFSKKSMGGYKPEEVDEFIDDVIDTVAEKDAYIRKLEDNCNKLAKAVEKYRQDEETVRSALLVTQKSADAMIKDAQEKSLYYKKAAEEEIKKKIVEAQIKNEKAKEKYVAITAEAAALKAELLAVYNKHIDIINSDLPSYKDVEEKKDVIDEKYPFEAQGEMKSVVDEEPVHDVEEEMVKATDTTANEEAKEDANDDIERIPMNAQQTSEEKKFNTLKFGDNYDVE